MKPSHAISRLHLSQLGVGLTCLAVLASGCTDAAPEGTARSSPQPEVSATSTGGPDGETSELSLLRITQLLASSSEPDSVAPAQPTFVVGKNISSTSHVRQSAVLAFAPLPVVGRCLLRAEVVLASRSNVTNGPVRLYPSAALSLAAGRLPPASSGGPGTLLDNRPAADGVAGPDGMQRFDVTDLLRLWADGGPFPSSDRRVPLHSPVVLNLRVPDLADGMYGITYASSTPKPRLVVSTQPACR